MQDLSNFPDRLRWNKLFDIEKLQRDVNNLIPNLLVQEYIYYNTVPLRTSTLKKEVIESNAQDLDYSDPNLYNWADTAEMSYCPYIKHILTFFETQVTNVRLMRLEPGAAVKEHSDPTLDIVFRSVIRLTIPIFSNEQTRFILDNKAVPMNPGELWYLQLSKLHAVYNDSPAERINLSVDIAVNDWVEKELARLFKCSDDGKEKD